VLERCSSSCAPLRRPQVREAELDERADRLMQQLKLDGYAAASQCASAVRVRACGDVRAWACGS
jgi:hypothetical protein